MHSQFLLALAVTLSGCASFEGRALIPGKSTAGEVQSGFGRPAEIIKLPGGEALWQYQRQPYGRQNYAVPLGPDNVVREVSQLLTAQNLATLQPGKSTADDVRRVLGPPFSAIPNPRLQREQWEYFMWEGYRPIIVYVQIDPNRMLREVLQTEDTSFTNFGLRGSQ
jgi:hypothetical protein